MIRRQVNDQGFRPLRLDCLHILGGLSIGQGQHHHIGGLSRHRLGIRADVAQGSGESIDVIRYLLPVVFARRHQDQFERGMRIDHANQLGTGMPACTDDGNAVQRHATRSIAAFRVAGLLAQNATQRSMSAKPSMPYQNTRQGSCLQQPSDSP